MDFWCAAAHVVAARCCERVARRDASVSASELGACVPSAASRSPRPFDRTRRIARRAEFERLLRDGKRHSAGGYLFYVAPRDSGPPRLGIVISRRHVRLAATRNAVKRYIREAFRLEQSALGSIDLLVRPPFGIRPSLQMMVQLRSLLGQLKDR